ncbi:hypothetical protein WJ73_19275 [Burkholderia ubonensis]|nr:hypothetical protein WJ73_19275 [Burkholderia ubonensis]
MEFTLSDVKVVGADRSVTRDDRGLRAVLFGELDFEFWWVVIQITKWFSLRRLQERPNRVKQNALSRASPADNCDQVAIQSDVPWMETQRLSRSEFAG